MLMGHEKTKMFQFTEGSTPDIPALLECELEDVPENVGHQIQILANTFEASNLQPSGKPMYMDFGKGGKVYVLAFNQTNHSEGYEVRIDAAYAVDINTQGKIMGVGISFLGLDENGQEKGYPPIMAWTNTEDEFKSQGLGTRRLVVLNEANKQMFNHFLTSGEAINEAAEAAWRKLTAVELAVQENDGSYRFIK